MEEVNIEISNSKKSFYVYSTIKAGESTIYDVDDDEHDLLSENINYMPLHKLKQNQETFSINKKQNNSIFSPLRIYPISNENLYSPIPIYTKVNIELAGGAKWDFSEIQDDMGNDAGFAVDEKELKARLKDTDLQAPFQYDWTHNEGEGTISICRIIIPEIGIDHFTVVIGITNLDNPLLGRFIIGDIQNKLYAGYLAENISLPLNSDGNLTEGISHSVDINTYSLTKLPDWNTVITKYRQSIYGKKLYTAVENEAQEGLRLYKQQAFLLALPHFQICSVWGFFSHDQEKYRTILYNLASTYYLLKDNRGLHWAKETQKLFDNDKVQNLISKFQQL